MNKRLFVGNIKWSVGNEQLSSIFGQYGTVISSEIIMDRETGRSRGFGFIEMATEEEARKVIESANGLAIDGRNIVINEAKPEGSGSIPPQVVQTQSPSQLIADFMLKAQLGELFEIETTSGKHFTIVRDDRETANGDNN